MTRIHQLMQVYRQYGLMRTGGYVARELKRIIVNQTIYGSYAQAYEDLEIMRLLATRTQGYYVDIGCHEPVRLSNTYLLYTRGWNGLVVDAAADYATEFARLRPRDTYVRSGIGSATSDPLEFFVHSASALSTFSREQSDLYISQGHPRIATIQVPVISLRQLFDTYCQGRHIDCMSLDIEGYDLPALESNDWERYRPYLICVEIAPSGDQVRHTADGDIGIYLKSQGYRQVSHRGVNAFYVDGSAKKL